MKFLCLAYYDEKKYEALPKTEMAAIESQCKPYDGLLRKSGKLIVHGSLQSPRAAKIVRPKGGKVSVTDGPYAETKEMVGGFFMIEAQDFDEAIRVASSHPAAHLGEEIGWGIEIRQVEFFEQL
jgi:hypothetical protein